jgi:hypothetical protein
MAGIMHPRQRVDQPQDQSIRHFKNSTSRFKGVRRADGGYIARIQFNKRRLYLGYFRSEEDAARAYDAKALELHGQFAVLNFPAAAL